VHPGCCVATCGQLVWLLYPPWPVTSGQWAVGARKLAAVAYQRSCKSIRKRVIGGALWFRACLLISSHLHLLLPPAASTVCNGSRTIWLATTTFERACHVRWRRHTHRGTCSSKHMTLTAYRLPKCLRLHNCPRSVTPCEMLRAACSSRMR
jgi:hypothetical protein